MTLSEVRGADRTRPASQATIMVAVDDLERSVDAVRVAHRLFGDAARYMVINVGDGPYSSMQWAWVYPVQVPTAWYPQLPSEGTAQSAATARGQAAHRAQDVADAGELGSATAVGAIGDPATAIIHAAHAHGVDVVVVGAHHRGWFSRLFRGSVERDLLREADFSILVVK